MGGAPPVGALAFNSLRAQRDWPDVLVQRLQLVAQVFANALARKRADLALRESEERRPGGGRSTRRRWASRRLDYGTGVFWVTEKLCDIVGYPREELLQWTFQDITHPDDLETDLEPSRQVLARRDQDLLDGEYAILRRDRSVVWST